MVKRKQAEFRILAWPRRSPSNVYTGALNDALERIPGVVVDELSYGRKQFLRLLARPPHVVHVHWLERAFWDPSKRKALRQAAHVAALITILKMRGARLVWTAHDPEPHRSPLNRWLTDQSSAGWWKRYERRLLGMIDGILLMSASHRSLVVNRDEKLAKLPMEVVRHPHYRGQYPDVVDKSSARKALTIRGDASVIVFIGSLRVYKNPDGLIEAFSKTPGDIVLLVAGEAETPERAEHLRTLAARDPRIVLHLGFVPDEDLSTWLRAGDVAVLPYLKVTNSGSAHLALSFDTPVLVPDEPVFRELEGLVGERWVKRYAGPISPEAIIEGVAWAKSPRPAHPDLSALDWDAIAAQTLGFLQKVSN